MKIRTCLLATGLLLLVPPSVQAQGLSISDVRSIDGSGNNKRFPDWGKAGTPLIRIAPVDYPGDGSGDEIVSDDDRANPRDVSNTLFAQTKLVPNDRRLSDFVWQWGQFLDHDIDLTHAAGISGNADITVTDPQDDLFPVIPLTRSEFSEESGTAGNPRQQVNQITAFIDASNVYGSDETTASNLRTFEGGKLKSSAGGALLPVGDNGFFEAGDVRVNEQTGLIVMHTLFMREHNRLCDRIARVDPSLDDEEIYQLARKIVGAEMQVITYREFLPALLGLYAPSPRGGRAYKPNVNPSIANEFSTAAYRFGHSMLSPSLLLVGPNGEVEEELALRDAFFAPSILQENPEKVESVLRGLATQQAQEVDALLVDDVRNFLFGAPGDGGLDLASLNIQRGRDHGLPGYNAMREAYGLRKARRFVDINPDPRVASRLQELYGDVDSIDAWVGGLAEDHGNANRSVGPLIGTILNQQFTRLRDGDRFYYKRDRDLRSSRLRRVIDVSSVTLSQVIRWNTGANLQRNVFLVDGSRKSPKGRGNRNAPNPDPQGNRPQRKLPSRAIDVFRRTLKDEDKS